MLSRKQTLKKRSTLTVLRDTYILCRTFIRVLFAFHKLKQSYKTVIEYPLPCASFISSYIITNKTLILSLFCKRRSSYFFAKTWSERLRLILQSFLKLESFGYNNNNVLSLLKLSS